MDLTADGPARGPAIPAPADRVTPNAPEARLGIGARLTSILVPRFADPGVEAEFCRELAQETLPHVRAGLYLCQRRAAGYETESRLRSPGLVMST